MSNSHIISVPCSISRWQSCQTVKPQTFQLYPRLKKIAEKNNYQYSFNEHVVVLLDELRST